jgi:hypothetical protein
VKRRLFNVLAEGVVGWRNRAAVKLRITKAAFRPVFIYRSLCVLFCLLFFVFQAVDVAPYPHERRDLIVLSFFTGIPAIFFFWLAISITSKSALRAKRLTIGQCVKCGYDLLATPERCPECGAILEKSK